MPVTRPCFKKLILTAWILYVVSLILIIVSISTDAWLIRQSSGEQKGIAPCCPAFECGRFSQAKVNDLDAFLAILTLGLMVAFSGGIASVVFTLKNKELKCLKCFYLVAAIIGSGGLLLMMAAIIFETTVPSDLNSIVDRQCAVFQDDIQVGGSFIVFVTGSVGVFFASLPLFAAIPKVRQPVMSGDVVEGNRTELTPAVAESGQQRIPPNNFPNETTQASQGENHTATGISADDIRQRIMRILGASKASEIDHPDADFWANPRVTPSAPDLDSISELSARIFSISDESNFELSSSEQTQIKQSNISHPSSHTVASSSLHLQHADCTSALPRTSDIISNNPQVENHVSKLKGTDSRISKQISKQISKLISKQIFKQPRVEEGIPIPEMSESFYSEIEQGTSHSFPEQPATNNYIPEQEPEAEYASIEEMVTGYVASTHPGYNQTPNVNQSTPQRHFSSSTANDDIIYEQTDIPSPTSDLEVTASPTIDLKVTASPTSDLKVTASPTSDLKVTASPTSDLKVTASPTSDLKETQHTLFEKLETDMSIPELQTILTSNSEQHNIGTCNRIVDQSETNQISEHSESEYVNLDTLSKFIASNQSESFYQNREQHSSSTDNLVYEIIEVPKKT